jgi:hypothetical protein
MANDLSAIMPKILARGLMTLRQRCIMPRLVNSDYSTDAAEKGDTIDVPIPSAIAAINVVPSYIPIAGQDTTLSKVQVSLNNWMQNQPFYLTDKDVLQIDRDKFYVPMQVQEAIKGLANAVNDSIFAEYKGVFGYTGTAGTTPFGTTGVTDATNARMILNQQLCPRDDRRGVLDFVAEANALALASFSEAQKIGSPDVVIQGEIGRKFGVDWYADDAVPKHTAGTITTSLISKASTPVAVGALTLAAHTAVSSGACALLKGDIILFAGDTQTYVLTADATQASADTDVTLTFYPGLKVAHTGSEAITVKAAHRVNLVFHRDAFAFATRPLIDSASGYELGHKILSMQDPVSGLVMRLEVSRQYKRVAWEFDILWGVKLVRPELAMRIAG